MADVDQLRRATALLLRRLRLDLRGVAGHLIRLFGAAMILVTIVGAVDSSMTIGSPGLAAFRWIVWCDALLISAASMTVFAAVIAGEREGGTLGLLRMTGTSPLILLLGQGVSGIVIGCLLLAIQFPFIVLTITLGGVLWNQVLAAFLALLGHLVLCAGIGLFFSTLCKRAGSAAFYTLLTQVGLWWGPWIARWIASRLSSGGRISSATEQVIEGLSSKIDAQLVWVRLNEIAASFGVLDVVSSQLWWSLAGGALLIGLSALVMDYRPIEVPPASPLIISLWKPSRGRAWGRWPIEGKDYRQFMGGARGLVARVVIYTAVPLLTGWLMNEFGGGRLTDDDIVAMVFWFGFAFLVIELNAIASRLFRNELTEQTWSTLVLLPRSFANIIVSKLGGAVLGLLPGLLITALAYASSEGAQEFWSRSSRTYEWIIPWVMVFCFVSFTSLASVMLSNLPPTAVIFCGVLAYFVHYALTVLAAMSLQSRLRMEMKSFNLFYASFWSLTSVTFLIVAFLRLRKLTARN
ncbi:hypothetical protein AYO47_05450 [Planctomyces sp. SCGC AG-212-M04]|nr:hypothetical protein AYO47_05450 [Planctomyces sp. SCGC AG-212-M04]